MQLVHFTGSEPDHVVACRSHLADLVNNLNSRYGLSMEATGNPYDQDFFTVYADGIYSSVNSAFVLTIKKFIRGGMSCSLASPEEVQVFVRGCNRDRTQVVSTPSA